MGNCNSTQDGVVKEKNRQMRLRMKERAKFVKRVMKGEATEEEIRSHNGSSSSRSASSPRSPGQGSQFSDLTEAIDDETEVPLATAPYPPLPAEPNADSTPSPAAEEDLPVRNPLMSTIDSPSLVDAAAEEEEEEAASPVKEESNDQEGNNSSSSSAASANMTPRYSHSDSTKGESTPSSCIRRGFSSKSTNSIGVDFSVPPHPHRQSDATVTEKSIDTNSDWDWSKRQSVANSLEVTFSQVYDDTTNSTSSPARKKRSTVDSNGRQQSTDGSTASFSDADRWAKEEAMQSQSRNSIGVAFSLLKVTSTDSSVDIDRDSNSSGGTPSAIDAANSSNDNDGVLTSPTSPVSPFYGSRSPRSNERAHLGLTTLVPTLGDDLLTLQALPAPRSQS